MPGSFAGAGGEPEEKNIFTDLRGKLLLNFVLTIFKLIFVTE